MSEDKKNSPDLPKKATKAKMNCHTKKEAVGEG
jgi:hypothetical protein